MTYILIIYFIPSGTGTTQAGLVCGQLINGDERQIMVSVTHVEILMEDKLYLIALMI